MNIYDRIINILLESRIEDYTERLDERRRSRNRGIPRDGSAPVKQTPAQRAQAKAASKKGRLGKADPVPMHDRRAAAFRAEGEEYEGDHGKQYQSLVTTGKDSYVSQARARRDMKGSKLPLPK
jgi:hypothetical protein